MPVVLWLVAAGLWLVPWGQAVVTLLLYGAWLLLERPTPHVRHTPGQAYVLLCAAALVLPVPAALLGVALLGALLAAALLPAPAAPPPPRPVAHTVLRWAHTRTTRPFAFSPDSEATTEQTTMEVHVWYPAARVGRTQPCKTWRAMVWPGTKDAKGWHWLSAWTADLQTHTQPAAAPAPGRWRPVLFSHGQGGEPTSCAALCTALAGAGHVVFAPRHDDRSTHHPGPLRRRQLDVALLRGWVAALQAGAAVPDGGAHLVGHIDTEAGYGFVGHSFGGTTAVLHSGLWEYAHLPPLMCSVYEADDGGAIAQAWGVCLDAWLTPLVFERLQRVRVPLLVVSASEWRNYTTPDRERLQRLAADPLVQEVVIEGNHHTLTDFNFAPWLIRATLPWLYSACELAPHVPVTATHELHALVLAFAQRPELGALAALPAPLWLRGTP